MARIPRGAGELDQWVAFEELNAIDDGYGNKQQAFIEQFRCHAGWSVMRGNESIQGARLEGTQPMIARVRYASQTTARIRHDWRMLDVRTGTYYALHSVSRTPDRGYIEMLLESGVATGGPP
jgi:head-tail adaptor